MTFYKLFHSLSPNRYKIFNEMANDANVNASDKEDEKKRFLQLVEKK
jgi:hypothetical protein